SVPAEVMQQAQEERLNWKHWRISVTGTSQRDPVLVRMAEQAEQDLRELMAFTDNYGVLFMPGAGRGHFSAGPQNIGGPANTVDYLNSGIWSEFAIREAEKYVNHVNVVASTLVTEQGKAIAAQENLQLSPHAAYFHYCPNETVDGIALHQVPD